MVASARLTPAAAQVNVEPLRDQLSDSGFGARVAGSVTSYAGNTQGVIFGSAGLAGARTDQHVAFLALSGDHARLNHVVSVAKWFAHARHNSQLSEALWWGAFGQVESDRFRRVVFRRLLPVHGYSWTGLPSRIARVRELTAAPSTLTGQSALHACSTSSRSLTASTV